jgi:CHAT domain-containing protein
VPLERATLEQLLTGVPTGDRDVLLSQTATLPALDLAQALKQIYFAHNSSSPEAARSVAAALDVLANAEQDPAVTAIAEWVRGMTCQLRGEMESSIAWLQKARTRFKEMGDAHSAALVEVSLLTALAIGGRYREAITCGEAALAFFTAAHDELSAGKIEQNLGGLYFRRDQYAQAEDLLRSARERFLELKDDKQLAQIENNIAVTLTQQHRFDEAAALYEQALGRAAAGNLDVTQAEIEDDLGQLALYQGRYEQALDYLERARRRFEALGIGHAAASAQVKLADAYLELNLYAEAKNAYERAIAVFHKLGMRIEEACALVCDGQARALAGELEDAQTLLAEARRLYVSEDNPVGEATVRLAEAQLHYGQGNFESAVTAATLADAPLADAHRWGPLLRTRWVRADALRQLGQTRAARRLLIETLNTAEAQGVPQIVLRCKTSLGLIAAATDDRSSAEGYFRAAAELAERLRSPLPAEEFRTAFVADKLVPFTQLVRLCLADPNEARASEALEYVERSRSRTLLDVLTGNLSLRMRARDASDATILDRVGTLHEELNWLYSQLNRFDSHTAFSEQRLTQMQTQVREREREIEEQLRHLQHLGMPSRGVSPTATHGLRAADLQRDIAPDSALVEYFMLDDELLAFVVTSTGLHVVRRLATRGEVHTAVEHMRFQLQSLRGGSARVRSHLKQLTARVQHYLHVLNDLLVAPLEPLIGARRLIVVPHDVLHYVPFHALFDGSAYMIEKREVGSAPSAGVLHQCLTAPRRPFERALLVGVPDDDIPHVSEELATLSQRFPRATTLTGIHATRAEVRANVRDIDVLHLACHSQFRPDNPLFSALRLGDGWMTAREAYDLHLEGALVTLSACETGMSAVAPGDELMGLVRGFFSAGAASLVVSLWTVDDESTAELMSDMYARLQIGDRPAAALRYAQSRALATYEHPFFWAPFAVFGRW